MSNGKTLVTRVKLDTGTTLYFVSIGRKGARTSTDYDRAYNRYWFRFKGVLSIKTCGLQCFLTHGDTDEGKQRPVALANLPRGDYNDSDSSL